MGNCCTSNPGGTGPELNSNTQENKAITAGGAKEVDKITLATVIRVQAFYRGWKARKDVKKLHNFECRTMMGRSNLPITQSDAEI